MEEVTGIMDTIFLSKLLGKRVFDKSGRCIGRLVDVVVDGGNEFPVTVGIQVRLKRATTHYVDWSQVTTMTTACWLKQTLEELPPCDFPESMLHLRRDVLDKQILDTERYRVVRVNDVSLVNLGEVLQVAAVDATTIAIFRRLGLEELITAIAELFGIKIKHQYIAWNQVEVLEGEVGGVIQLKVPKESLEVLHPADVASIVQQLEPGEMTQVFEQLDTELAADALAEIEDEVQTAIIESLEDERAAEIIAEMDPDEAADLLGDLPEERREDLLEMMEARHMIEEEEAEDIQELLSYDDESAGGLMTTQYVTVRDTMTAQEAINLLRELAPPADAIYYVFVVDSEERLLGVLPLRELIIAPPDKPVREFMITDVVRVTADHDDEEVAQLMAKYDLLMLPVVDEDEHLLGTVTINDAMDVLIPEQWKRRLRHIQRRPRKEGDG